MSQSSMTAPGLVLGKSKAWRLKLGRDKGLTRTVEGALSSQAECWTPGQCLLWDCSPQVPSLGMDCSPQWEGLRTRADLWGTYGSETR